MSIQDWVTALNLSAGEQNDLGRALGDSNLAADRLDLLAQTAFDEYVEWLIGRRRFNTVSELDTHRTFHLFNDIRDEAPTVESLANEVHLSPGKAISILSRLRYGEARILARRAKEKAIQSIDAQAAANTKKRGDGRGTVWLDGDEYEAIMSVVATMIRLPSEHAKGKKWQGFERPDSRRDKYLAEVTATLDTWKHIKQALLDEVEQP